jgi:hypothetical protein
MQIPTGPVALVSRSKLALLQHIGVMLPDGRVAHCTPERGEHVSSIEEFADGKDVMIGRVIAPERQLSTLQRIAAAMATPGRYALITNNCEIFANRCIGERPQSPQLVGTALFVGLALLVGFGPK